MVESPLPLAGGTGHSIRSSFSKHAALAAKLPHHVVQARLSVTGLWFCYHVTVSFTHAVRPTGAAWWMSTSMHVYRWFPAATACACAARDAD